MSDALRLFGLKAIVTDASSGIGEAIARTFAQHGAQVLAVGAPSTGIDQQFKGVHGIKAHRLDLFNAGALDSLQELVDSELGTLDIVVNNYDWSAGAPIGDDDSDEIARIVKNIESQIPAVAQFALPLLQKSPAGRIISIGCVRTMFSRDGEAAAAQARKALADVTAKIAAESGQYGVTANYVQPGAIMTATSRRIFSSDTDLRDFCIRHSAAGRLGEPIDIAKVVLFLATDDAAFVSGTGIAADGGLMPVS
jgi:NAD(P)-dependent dehydrogenase (short-subunit alcohol dehydrogenase family)